MLPPSQWNRTSQVLTIALIAGVYAVWASLPAQQEGVPPQRRADETWPMHGRDAAETRYSPLTQVNAQNVGDLVLAWSTDIPKAGARQETSPIVSDGVMYVTGPMSFVFALDAVTGAVKWQYDPEIRSEREGGPHACCGNVNRGAAVDGDKVFVGLLDGRLVALNKTDGKLVWSVQTTPVGSDYTITGAPRVVRGRVVIGNAGAEYGVRGYVTAYDAATGRQLWRTYTVPGNPALGFENEAMRRAAATWTGEWWKIGGGGTVWDAMAFDPVANLLYIGTGNGSPWSRDHRSPQGGDNLYLSSILALDPNDGRIVWHYQTSPGDDWDYTATQPLMLLDLTIDGRARKVIVQAPKNGFFYVIDRLTGKLISAHAFADDLTWASGVDMSTGRPIETPIARYGSKPDGVYISPSPVGAHNWHTMSWNPATGLVYLPAMNNAYLFRKTPQLHYRAGVWNTGTDRGGGSPPPAPTLKGPPTLLLAWDPVANREKWRVRISGGHGGTLATAGNLVFWGSGTRLIAVDARTGDQLWTREIGRGPGSPVTYSINGRQYITIAAGSGTGEDRPRVWTFALPAGAPR
ncbi:MAG: PQQ-dependent dehydrogenase, methanol/ethanol family [Gemmatimonadota bacterium]